MENRAEMEDAFMVSDQSIIQWQKSSPPPKDTFVLIRIWEDHFPECSIAYVDLDGNYRNCGAQSYVLNHVIDAWAYLPYDSPEWWSQVTPFL